MSYKIIAINGQINSSDLKEFICQDENDITKLPRYGINGTQESEYDTVSNQPCAIGSKAIVCSTSNVYILSPDNAWVKLFNYATTSSSGGSSPSDKDINPITNSQIESLFSQ